MFYFFFFFFSSRRRHTRLTCDWSSDVCSSDLGPDRGDGAVLPVRALPPAARRVRPPGDADPPLRTRRAPADDHPGRALAPGLRPQDARPSAARTDVTGDPAEVTPLPSPPALIGKKRDGGVLSDREIAGLVQGLV